MRITRRLLSRELLGAVGIRELQVKSGGVTAASGLCPLGKKPKNYLQITPGSMQA